jgi:hypothetical protein
VADGTAPALMGVQGGMTVEATGPEGAIVDLVVPSATDLVDGSVSVTSNPVLPCHCGPGETVVTFSATDVAGNTATATTTVIVLDTTAPVFTSVPAGITAEAAGPYGATVTLPPAVATDAVDANVVITSDAPAGGVFPLGSTTVTFTATDASRNATTASTVVTVADGTAPALMGVPGGMTVEATGPDGGDRHAPKRDLHHHRRRPQRPWRQRAVRADDRRRAVAVASTTFEHAGSVYEAPGQRVAAHHAGMLDIPVPARWLQAGHTARSAIVARTSALRTTRGRP